MKGVEGIRRMKELIRSRVFIDAFLITYASFFLVTHGILDISGPGVGVGTVNYGFPFTYYVSHCFGGTYISSGLLGNILFAAILGTIIGVFCAYVWKTLSSEDFRKRWNL